MNDRPMVQVITLPTEMKVQLVTDFQLWPENGGFVLVLGSRSLKIENGSFGGLPNPQIEAVSASYFSHSMMKDLARVFGLAVKNFEETFGAIPLPGLTPETPTAENSK